uniref:Uncharacterized protein n=1 Tax=Oryza barthii TaxID=65489 RepID=A0A0D3FT98_9ORYZ
MPEFRRQASPHLPSESARKRRRRRPRPPPASAAVGSVHLCVGRRRCCRRNLLPRATAVGCCPLAPDNTVPRSSSSPWPWAPPAITPLTGEVGQIGNANMDVSAHNPLFPFRFTEFGFPKIPPVGTTPDKLFSERSIC